jgi:poly(A) polymerase
MCPTPDADIDTLLVAPRHIDRDDFFSLFYELLLQEKGVAKMRAIEDAYVPVIKLEFEEIGVTRHDESIECPIQSHPFSFSVSCFL